MIQCDKYQTKLSFFSKLNSKSSAALVAVRRYLNIFRSSASHPLDTHMTDRSLHTTPYAYIPVHVFFHRQVLLFFFLCCYCRRQTTAARRSVQYIILRIYTHTLLLSYHHYYYYFSGTALRRRVLYTIYIYSYT